MDDTRKYGLFFENIMREEVPFDSTELEDFDMIENTSGQRLLFHRNENGKYYQYVHDDYTQFISESQMYSPWHKL